MTGRLTSDASLSTWHCTKCGTDWKGKPPTWCPKCPDEIATEARYEAMRQASEGPLGETDTGAGMYHAGFLAGRKHERAFLDEEGPSRSGEASPEVNGERRCPCDTFSSAPCDCRNAGSEQVLDAFCAALGWSRVPLEDAIGEVRLLRTNLRVSEKLRSEAARPLPPETLRTELREVRRLVSIEEDLGDALRRLDALLGPMGAPRPAEDQSVFDIRCTECGEKMTSHVPVTRHADGPCEERYTGPEIISYTPRRERASQTSGTAGEDGAYARPGAGNRAAPAVATSTPGGGPEEPGTTSAPSSCPSCGGPK